jgi:hypothetical protein
LTFNELSTLKISNGANPYGFLKIPWFFKEIPTGFEHKKASVFGRLFGEMTGSNHYCPAAGADGGAVTIRLAKNFLIDFLKKMKIGFFYRFVTGVQTAITVLSAYKPHVFAFLYPK